MQPAADAIHFLDEKARTQANQEKEQDLTKTTMTKTKMTMEMMKLMMPKMTKALKEAASKKKNAHTALMKAVTVALSALDACKIIGRKKMHVIDCTKFKYTQAKRTRKK